MLMLSPPVARLAHFFLNLNQRLLHTLPYFNEMTNHSKRIRLDAYYPNDTNRKESALSPHVCGLQSKKPPFLFFKYVNNVSLSYTLTPLASGAKERRRLVFIPITIFVSISLSTFIALAPTELG